MPSWSVKSQAVAFEVIGMEETYGPFQVRTSLIPVHLFRTLLLGETAKYGLKIKTEISGHLFIYLIHVLRQTQEYFTHMMATSILVGGNKAKSRIDYIVANFENNDKSLVLTRECFTRYSRCPPRSRYGGVLSDPSVA